MKKIVIFLLLVCNLLSVHAQTMGEVFAAMPDSLQLLLSKNNRLDMLDFKKFNMEAKVVNRMDANSVLDTLTEDYLKVTLSSLSTLEMKLYPQGDSRAVLMVHTVAGPVKDSSLSFYTTDWKPLPVSVHRPAFQTFEKQDRSSLTEEQAQLLDFLADMQLTEARIYPGENVVTFHLSLDILNKEDREKVKDLVQDVRVELK